MSARTHYRGQVAALTRSRRADDPELVAARRNLRASTLEDFIRRTVEATPPLTDEQRAHLADLLRPVPSARPTSGAPAEAVADG